MTAHGLPTAMEADLTGGDESFSWPDTVWDSVMSFPLGSAPGPSGVRPGLVKDLLAKEGRNGSLHIALQTAVEKGCAGELPKELAPLLCAATLIPLKKPCGGVRPIAVGETLRRLIGKALLRTPTVQKDIGSMAPRQTGVAVQAAAELIGLGFQRVVDNQDPGGDWIAVQVDVINAFNTIRREAVLAGAKAKVPGAYNWLAYCYTQHVPLFCQGEALLQSEMGVHQGDSCGPLGFALGLDLALDACAQEAQQLTWGVWYLDDGTLMGQASHVLRYLGVLQVALANVGLALNPTKCKAWGPGLQKANERGPTYPVDLPQDHIGRCIPVVPFSPGSGVTSLGVPIDAPGGNGHSKAVWDKVVGQTTLLLDRLRLFPTAWTRHVLLRYCLDGCKVMHLLRSTGGIKAGDALGQLSGAIRQACADLVGGDLSDLAYAQCTLPASKAGAGVKDPTLEGPAARLAALCGLELRGRSLVGVPEIAFIKGAPDLAHTMQAFGADVGPQFDPCPRGSRIQLRSLLPIKPMPLNGGGRKHPMLPDGAARQKGRQSGTNAASSAKWAR